MKKINLNQTALVKLNYLLSRESGVLDKFPEEMPDGQFCGAVLDFLEEVRRNNEILFNQLPVEDELKNKMTNKKLAKEIIQEFECDYMYRGDVVDNPSFLERSWYEAAKKTLLDSKDDLAYNYTELALLKQELSEISNKADFIISTIESSAKTMEDLITYAEAKNKNL